jgi:coenzyme F420 hydrogenase subunit beta
MDSGRCFAYCPRIELDQDNLNQTVLGEVYPDSEIGTVRRIFAARSSDPRIRGLGQTGGTTSALLCRALDSRLADAALVNRTGEDKRPQTSLVRNREEVLAGAGSSYVSGPGLQAFNRLEPGQAENPAVVGLPCQVQALARIRFSEHPGPKPIQPLGLVIGLFCNWALQYRPFINYLQKNLPVDQISRMDITPPPERLVKLTGPGGSWELPLEEVRQFIRPGCDACLDLTAELADISVGTVEGWPGWNLVVVRSAAGEALLEAAEKNADLEVKELPAEFEQSLRKAAKLKKARALSWLEENGGLADCYIKGAVDFKKQLAD